MKNKSILINCSNLHGGGSTAVAVSFIDSLSRIESTKLSFSLLVSNVVLKNLLALGIDFSKFTSVKVVDFFGIGALFLGLGRYFVGHDLIFTVFGPCYVFFPGGKHIVGFAQPNIIYPEQKSMYEPSIVKRFLLNSKYFIQSFFYSLADIVVVEHSHVKIRLEKKLFFLRKNIIVVPGAINRVFFQNFDLADNKYHVDKNKLKIGVIARNYPHKNLGIYPKFLSVLNKKHKIEAVGFLTMSADEFHLFDDEDKFYIRNVGPLTIDECPTFYRSMDLIVFPTLLECFSSVPIEAFCVGRPLLCSDFPFIQEVCGDAALYFDPLSAEDIADKIIFFLENPEIRRSMVDSGLRISNSYSDADARSLRYLSIIEAAVFD